ncbi:hypothetical protein KGF56_001068 [Candida oxycetoniae]|uniref:Sulfurtransferase n=1 Tax=Candida oxycetoniae TaxID=497107 RepID=A0AAI9T0Z3_9ASCO|nr:uncharacterized protein KGF56_001068 [Candida oxycetoniae]KAI3406226.2 hypothetical protein KGF56_001068 [Candida oxycetoniae]
MTKPFLSIIKPSSFRTLLQSQPQSQSPPQSSSTLEHRTIPIDATWFMPNSPRNAEQEYQTERIPHARFFNLDKYSRDSPYPHMLPTQQIAKQAFQDLSIRPSDNLVIYDKIGNFSSPRAAFTFKLFGHQRVYLLDNYLNYKACDYPLDLNPVNFKLSSSDAEENEYPLPSAHEFEETYDREVIEYEELCNLVEDNCIGDYLILDARSKERFTGEASEPRPGLSSGHIPTARNLPFTKFLNPEQNNQFRSKEEIETILKDVVEINDINELTTKYPGGIIVMCGTGVTACILKLALDNVLKLHDVVNVRLYDGSWTEWAMRAPKELIVKDV